MLYAIIDALRLQHTTVRVVSEAAGRTLVEGERSHRPGQGWVAVHFVFN